jgi:HK97 family phage major capsid protein
MNIQEQLRVYQQKRNEASERQLALMNRAGEEGRTLDEEEKGEYDSLDTELESIDGHLKRLRKHVEENKGGNEVKTKGPTVLVRTQDRDDDFKGQSYIRKLIARTLAEQSGFEQTASQIAEHRWGKTHPNLCRVIKSGIVTTTKAGIGGHGSSSGEAGAELVAADGRFTGDFIEFLHDMTVFDRLPLREVPANVTIKGQDGAATGYWVGESKAIPVSVTSYSTVNLTPLKVAALTTITNELLRDSSPSAEIYLRDSLGRASAERVDTTFVSQTAASAGVSPAGILNGLAPLGSNGATAALVREDINELYAPFLSGKHSSGLIFLMTPTRAKATSLLFTTLGVPEFPGLGAQGGTLMGDQVITGDNIGATHVILIDPREIWRIGDGGVQVTLSRDATIEQDTAPQGAQDTPTAASATLMSMFQTESTAFKVVRSINFQKRRTDAVAWMEDAIWGNAALSTT